MKWVTTESCSYSPPTYCICLYHRSSYHLGFMVFLRSESSCFEFALQNLTQLGLRISPSPSPHRLDECGPCCWLKMDAGRRKPSDICSFWSWEMIRKSWETSVWWGPCWIPVPPHMTAEMQAVVVPEPACSSAAAALWVPECFKDVPDLSQEKSCFLATFGLKRSVQVYRCTSPPQASS